MPAIFSNVRNCLNIFRNLELHILGAFPVCESAMEHLDLASGCCAKAGAARQGRSSARGFPTSDGARRHLVTSAMCVHFVATTTTAGGRCTLTWWQATRCHLITPAICAICVPRPPAGRGYCTLTWWQTTRCVRPMCGKTANSRRLLNTRMVTDH